LEGHIKGRDPVLLRLRVGGGLDDRPLSVLVVPLEHLVKEREVRIEKDSEEEETYLKHPDDRGAPGHIARKNWL